MIATVSDGTGVARRRDGTIAGGAFYRHLRRPCTRPHTTAAIHRPPAPSAGRTIVHNRVLPPPAAMNLIHQGYEIRLRYWDRGWDVMITDPKGKRLDNKKHLTGTAFKKPDEAMSEARLWIDRRVRDQRGF
jgi:hypothetical protein